MKKLYFILTSILSLSLVLFFAFSSGTSLEDYVSRNQNEADIIDLLVKFQTAKQQFDLETYLSCLDENGSFMFSGHLMVSKQELSTLLPDFWKGLKTNDPHVRPMCRENLNGNFFNGSFFDPIISIKKGNAQVTLTFQTPVIRWRALLFLNVIRKNGRWLISKYEWDMG